MKGRAQRMYTWKDQDEPEGPETLAASALPNCSVWAMQQFSVGSAAFCHRPSDKAFIIA